MKIIAIVGSQEFKALWKVERYVDDLATQSALDGVEIKIISGGAEGPDTKAVQTARKFKIPTEVFRPEKDKNVHPRYAPLVRNTKIAMACDHMVAFWDGKSPGTLDAIKKAIQYGKMVIVNPE